MPVTFTKQGIKGTLAYKEGMKGTLKQYKTVSETRKESRQKKADAVPPSKKSDSLAARAGTDYGPGGSMAPKTSNAPPSQRSYSAGDHQRGQSTKTNSGKKSAPVGSGRGDAAYKKIIEKVGKSENRNTNIALNTGAVELFYSPSGSYGTEYKYDINKRKPTRSPDPKIPAAKKPSTKAPQIGSTTSDKPSAKSLAEYSGKLGILRKKKQDRKVALDNERVSGRNTVGNKRSENWAVSERKRKPVSEEYLTELKRKVNAANSPLGSVSRLISRMTDKLSGRY